MSLGELATADDTARRISYHMPGRAAEEPLWGGVELRRMLHSIELGRQGHGFSVTDDEIAIGERGQRVAQYQPIMVAEARKPGEGERLGRERSQGFSQQPRAVGETPELPIPIGRGVGMPVGPVVPGGVLDSPVRGSAREAVDLSTAHQRNEPPQLIQLRVVPVSYTHLRAHETRHEI